MAGIGPYIIRVPDRALEDSDDKLMMGVLVATFSRVPSDHLQNILNHLDPFRVL